MWYNMISQFLGLTLYIGVSVKLKFEWKIKIITILFLTLNNWNWVVQWMCMPTNYNKYFYYLSQNFKTYAKIIYYVDIGINYIIIIYNLYGILYAVPQTYPWAWLSPYKGRIKMKRLFCQSITIIPFKQYIR